MKKYSQIFVIGVVLLFLEVQAYSQITVTQSDINAIFSVGNTIRLFRDTTSRQVNVGHRGGPNVYDFSTLPFYFAERETVYSVSQIPQLTSHYPQSAITIKQTDGTGGFEYPIYTFSSDWRNIGLANIFSTTTQRYRHYNETLIALPLTAVPDSLTSPAWSSGPGPVQETTYVSGIPSLVNSWIQNAFGSSTGYGTLLLPGHSLNCLRIRSERPQPLDPLEFVFITQEGAILVVKSQDTQSDTGVINTSGIYYFLGSSLSSVKEIDGMPTDFNLSQNYPNPFNPSTTIQFSLPKSSFVTIDVYNVLGQSVKTLVEKYLTAGNFQVTWDAGNLPSGVYLYRMNAGDFVKQKKLILLK